jgi:HAE1 family hydrophobic/amphiphilic exporter-1
VQVAAGQVGGAPAPTGTTFQYSVLAQGRLKTVEEFENIIITQGEAGRSLRVKDVARVELGAKTYSFDSRFNQGPAALISIYQLPGANAMSTAERVRERMAELAGSSNWPAGVNYQVPFDTTAFVSASIDEVYSTLVMAVVLVVLVIFVFLQDWRATVIPVVAIPVSLIGTFLVLAALGFSINMLTLFGVVLAIGIVVDDAIVVVENTSRFLADGFEPKEAAARAMDEITGPVIATTLVLLAVFVPTAFMGGITGQLFRQFALTISGAVLISTVNALTLSPALCGLLLRKPREPWFVGFRWFNRVFDSATSLYARVIGGLLRVTALVLIVYVGLVGLAGWSLGRLPTGFVPQEDQGYLFVNVQLPDGATLQRTREVMGDLESLVAETPGVADIVNVAGYSLLGGYAGSNTGFVVAILEPWEQRRSASLQIDAIQAELRERFSRVRGAIAFAFQPPAIDGLGVAGGFQLEVLDQGGAGSGRLQLVAQDLAATGNAQSRLQGLSTTFRANVPQLYVDIDRARVKQLDIPLSSVFRSLQGYLGSAYVNDFTYNNRSYQVRLQADAAFRSDRRDIGKLKVRNRQGQMVPLAAVLDVQEALGPSVISRFQMYPSASINGSAARGVSSGEALNLMEELATSRLPPGFGYAWTGMSYQERQAASGQAVVLALSVLAVFLVLAAQYESWLSPAAVIAVVPLAALGVVLALLLRGSDNNTYTQIGLVLLIALASKNAILIVEFANEKRDQGLSPREASREAARLRFRAILMTAFSSILGFLPLLIAAGAGAASRQAVGNAVVGGMIAATIFSLLLVPSFAFIAQWVGARLSGNGRTAAATADESADG